MCLILFMCFFFSSRRRHTRCALVTGVQTCALPISARRKIAPRFPVARDAHRQQYRIIAKAREPVRRPAEAGAIFGRELAVEPVRDAGEPRPAHRGIAAERRVGIPQFGAEDLLVARALDRSEEHTSELQSLMRISYAVFC